MAKLRKQNFSLLNPGSLINIFNPQSYQGDFGDWASAVFTGSYDYDDSDAYSVIAQALSGNEKALALWDSLPDYSKHEVLSKYSDSVKDFYNFWDLGGDATELNVDRIVEDLVDASNMDTAMPVKPTRESIFANIDEDPEVRQYLAELAESEERQTSLFENQLKENQIAFDDYRSQLLGNQYQQNAQLIGSVDSAMSKARRNALEAGASAGLRMAENINTTLALQNKQSQTSLETSNQLAQQLLNQRQAAAGIRSEYSQMLDNNVERRQNVRQQAADRKLNAADSDYRDKLANWESTFDNSSNYFAEHQKNNLRKQSSQYNQ